jgi:hypothetical protein
VKILKAIAVSFCVLFVVILTFVSVLGENAQVDDIVIEFFDHVKEGDSSEACGQYTLDSKCSIESGDSNDVVNPFALNLVLMNHYRITDNDYKVEVSRDNMWLPLIDKPSVTVSVRFVPNNTLIKNISNPAPDYIEGLLTVQRADGRWRISGFNIKNSKISDDYDSVVSIINAKRFFTSDQDTILLEELLIETKDISKNEVMIIINMLHEFENLLKNRLLSK